jgi:hypothetical protein
VVVVKIKVLLVTAGSGWSSGLEFESAFLVTLCFRSGKHLSGFLLTNETIQNPMEECSS